MQTAQTLFQSHYLHNMPKFIVLPDLREKIMSINDFPLRWTQIREENFFLNWDFTHIEKVAKSKYWFLREYESFDQIMNQMRINN